MSLRKLDNALSKYLQQLEAEGRAKQAERVITGYVKPSGDRGCRYQVKGQDKVFIRMNTNGYLNLSNHPKLMEAADDATHRFGVGPGAVRFIDGTFEGHVVLEERIARFVGKPSAKIFNSAYTSNLALALALDSDTAYWIGDELNHNSIIRAMRIANIPKERRAFFKHNDLADLQRCLEKIPEGMKRVCAIFDGIFSMRGDCAPMPEILALLNLFDSRFEEGVISIVDDSHGIGAYGVSGRGTCEYTGAQADIIVGTFGKAFGVNGGFIAGSQMLSETIRQKSDTYIYTNPLSPADCAAAIAAIDLVDSPQGIDMLADLQKKTAHFRNGLKTLGMESIEGPHPVVPILVRETAKAHRLVQFLFDRGVLVVGLTFPVVPKGSETLRIQINAGLTFSDLDYVLALLDEFNHLENR